MSLRSNPVAQTLLSVLLGWGTVRGVRLALCAVGILFGIAVQTLNAAENYLTPVELKISRDATKLYVVCEDSDELLVLDRLSQRVLAKISVGHKPQDVAIAPDGRSLYVSNQWSDTVSVIDAANFKVRATLKSGWGPVGLTTDRPGKILYVANSISNDISVIDLAKGVELTRLSSPRSPHHVLLSRDGRHVYVANLLAHLGQPNQPPVSELTVIATERRAVSNRILIPGVLELRHIAEAPASQGNFLLIPFMRPKISARWCK